TTTDPMTSLATNFVAITRAAQLRLPAMRALFPSLALGAEALGVPAYDNEFHAMIDIWPRPYCTYDTPVYRNEVVQDGAIPKWNY
ncbi:mammalian cell entry protein, partial [Klebsiella pneumoniae]|nr:mammalian cell entry protein [Klebsiella pneumoniae]